MLLCGNKGWQDSAPQKQEMEVLYPVCINTADPKQIVATAPDFNDLSASDADRQRLLTRIHLKMEGAASQMLLQGLPLPSPSPVSEIRRQHGSAESEALVEVCVIDINPVHLAAVAKHQAGR